jgi:hypothetical protein
LLEKPATGHGKQETMLKFIFNPKKSTQVAAYLLKLNKGDMEKYLFIKMLYLADREALDRWGDPITGDSAVSMPYGPVLSTIYNLTKGECRTLRSYWEHFISDADEETNRVSLQGDPGISELSRSEIKIIEAVYSKFKRYTWKRIHDYCAKLGEYEDVGKSSKALPAERILKSLGKTSSEIAELKQKQIELQVADLLLGR